MFAFGKAVELLKEGDRVCRQGWNGKDMFLFLVKLVPWLASQTDVLAEDWIYIVDNK